jgi:hypothetical protein
MSRGPSPTFSRDERCYYSHSVCGLFPSGFVTGGGLTRRCGLANVGTSDHDRIWPRSVRTGQKDGHSSRFLLDRRLSRPGGRDVTLIKRGVLSREGVLLVRRSSRWCHRMTLVPVCAVSPVSRRGTNDPKEQRGRESLFECWRRRTCWLGVARGRVSGFSVRRH